MLLLERRKVASWSWLPATGEALRRELEFHALERELPVVAYGDSPGLRDMLVNHELIETGADKPLSRTGAASRAAGRIVRGVEEPPVELRRDQLGRRQSDYALRRYLLALKAAALVFVAAVCGALMVQAERYDEKMQHLAGLEREVFAQLFPTQRVPVGVQNRLESELTKLEALSGESFELSTPTAALEVLFEILDALPANMRFRLAEIRIEEGRIYIDGEAREHSDAERIAQLLRSHGFNIPAPRTQRLEGQRITFRIVGSYQSPVAGKAPK